MPVVENSTYLRAKLRADRQAPLDIELLARSNILDSQQEHDRVDLPGRWAGVLLRRRRRLPDSSVWGLHHAAVAPD